MKSYFDKHLEKLVKIKPIVPKIRLCMFMSTHLKNFYDKRSKEFSICTGFIISCVTLYGENQAIATEVQ